MAFEEFGVMPELVRAVTEEGWRLATDVQGEAIPAILGGSDVMVAAETGSGKTGAFALPVLQTIHETRRAAAAGQTSGAAPSAAELQRLVSAVSLDAGDRDRDFSVSEDGSAGQSRRQDRWAGARATVGVKGGSYYFEATVADEGICRAGWSTVGAAFNLGTDAAGFGYGGTAMKSNGGKFEPYGAKFGKGDTVGCTLNLADRTVSFSRNGEDQGVAFTIPPSLPGPFYPAVAMRNGEVACAFGGSRSPLRFPPPGGARPLAEATPEHAEYKRALEAHKAAAGAARTGRGRPPLAVVVEPTRDLAEQTYNVFSRFSMHLRDPTVSAVLLIGGPPEPQKRALSAGCDVVVGTAQRLADLASRGSLDVSAVRFFVLDEADQLLSTEASEDVLKLFGMVPRNAGTRQTDRLQVCFFSATLHSEEVRKYSGTLCHRPIWVDLKGRDAVPETVHHLVVPVDPGEGGTLSRGRSRPITDGVHVGQNVDADSADGRSERIKRLKQLKLVEVIEALGMDQCLIFCRTNVDCDNLERFLSEASGGGGKFTGKREKGKENRYSCVVLAGMRSMEERRRNLQAFHDGDVRFLICTDVAARGIDVRGLPFVVNLTLPDRSENYIHRIGRVGRAERMGLAVSLVATAKERVWYHKCNRKDRGRGCRNTRLLEEGGCTTWYDEPALLKEVEGRLHRPIARLGPGLELPEEMRNVQYGGEAAATVVNEDALRRLQELKPALQLLAELEVEAQRCFLALPRKFGAAAPVGQ